jgi:hypothetical protein
MLNKLRQRNHSILILIETVKRLHGLLVYVLRLNFEVVCPLALLQELISIGVDGPEVG